MRGLLQPAKAASISLILRVVHPDPDGVSFQIFGGRGVADHFRCYSGPPIAAAPGLKLQLSRPRPSTVSPPEKHRLNLRFFRRRRALHRDLPFGSSNAANRL